MRLTDDVKINLHLSKVLLDLFRMLSGYIL